MQAGLNSCWCQIDALGPSASARAGAPASERTSRRMEPGRDLVAKYCLASVKGRDRKLGRVDLLLLSLPLLLLL